MAWVYTYGGLEVIEGVELGKIINLKGEKNLESGHTNNCRNHL